MCQSATHQRNGACDRGRRSDQAVRPGAGCRRLVVHRRRGPRGRLSRTERCGQDHHAADAARAGEPDGGRATVQGSRYVELGDPVHTVGSVLDGGMFHPGRSGRNHLRALAKAAGIGDARVDELLQLVALSDAANRRAGGYSLGMRQRLGLAAALLGDPKVLVLDEPANGLDPQGIRWLRDFLRTLAERRPRGAGLQPRAGRGRPDRRRRRRHQQGQQRRPGAADGDHGPQRRRDEGRRAGRAQAGRHPARRRARRSPATPPRSSSRTARGEDIGRVVAEHQFVISELSPVGSSLEEIYLELTESTGRPVMIRLVGSELFKLRTTRTFYGDRGRLAGPGAGDRDPGHRAGELQPVRPPAGGHMIFAAFAQPFVLRARHPRDHERVPARHDHAEPAGRPGPRAARAGQARRVGADRARARAGDDRARSYADRQGHRRAARPGHQRRRGQADHRRDGRHRRCGPRSASASARSCATRSARSSARSSTCSCSRTCCRSSRASTTSSTSTASAGSAPAVRRHRPGDDLLGQVPGGLLLAAYAAILVIAGILVVQRRDVTA